MQCSQYSGELETRKHDSIMLLRCNRCYGILIKDHMLTETFARWMTESFLDVDAPSLSKKYDRIDDINCPL